MGEVVDEHGADLALAVVAASGVTAIVTGVKLAPAWT